MHSDDTFNIEINLYTGPINKILFKYNLLYLPLHFEVFAHVELFNGIKFGNVLSKYCHLFPS